MPAQPFWECLRLAETLMSKQFHDDYFAVPMGNGFEPGDIAYLEGSLHQVFEDYMVTKGYDVSLYKAPRARSKPAGRYCLVLMPLQNDKYLVCYLTSFGGAKGYQEVDSLMGRTFGLPIGETTHWPGILPLASRPMWKGGFIFAIPTVREGLKRPNLSLRCRLVPSELERVKSLIRERQLIDDETLLQIHRENVLQLRRARHVVSGKQPKDHTIIRHEGSKNSHRKHLAFPVYYGNRWRAFSQAKPFPTNFHNISWLLRHMHEDLRNRSDFLNKIPMNGRKFTSIPQPFFARSLRASTTSIGRLIH